MPDFPINDVLAPVGWIFLALLAANLLLFAALVVLREQWAFHARRRERIRSQLEPFLERLLTGDPDRAVDELRSRVASLGREERPVAAWCLEDLTRDADEATRRGVRDLLDETGAIELAEQSTGAPGAEAFRRGLRSPDPTIRVASCFGVAALSAEDASSATEAVAQRLAGDDDTRVRTAAAKALGVIGRTTPPRVLVEAAHDPELRVRGEAVVALGLFDAPDSVDLLAAAAQDPDREVALRSAEALLALGARPAAGAAARAALASSPAWSVDYVRTTSELAA